MIVSLRQRHRKIVCALGVLLPLTFAAGIAARRPVPVAGPLPSDLAAYAADFGKVAWSRPDVFPNQRIITSLRRNANGSVAVEFMSRDIVRSDVLVYWAAGKEGTTESLPGDARLLGVFANRTSLPILEDVRGKVGHFILYSLADHEIIAVSNPFTIQRFNDSTF